jgi:hypothetical protein
MTASLRCPHCRESFDVPSSFLGRDVTCLTCSKPFIAPKTSEAPAASPPQPVSAPPKPPSAQPPTAQPRSNPPPPSSAASDPPASPRATSSTGKLIAGRCAHVRKSGNGNRPRCRSLTARWLRVWHREFSRVWQSERAAEADVLPSPGLFPTAAPGRLVEEGCPTKGRAEPGFPVQEMTSRGQN